MLINKNAVNVVMYGFDYRSKALGVNNLKIDEYAYF